MQRDRNCRRCSAERLERRCLLAGDALVSLSSGDLIVRGDESDNQIEITQEAGAIHIEGVDDTTINGAQFVDISGLSDDLRILMRQGGEDDVAILGQITVPGGLRVRMGDGALTIDGSAGPVRIGQELLVSSSGDASVLNDVRVAGQTGITADGQVNVVAGRALLPDFSSAVFDDPLTIDNPYFPTVPGTVYTYRATTVDPETGETHVEVTVVEVLATSRTIMGVETREVRDRVTLDGLLIEDTIDRFGQDNNGNVWYFGESVINFHYDDTGNLIGTDSEGSFEAGVDGALPGINMEANPQTGDRYYQEFAPRVALDQAEVIGLDESVTVPFGTFGNLLQTLESTVLEPDSLGSKFYSPGLGLVLDEDLDFQTGEVTDRAELISVELNGMPVTEIVPPDAFAGTSPTGQITRRIRLLEGARITAGDSAIVRNVRFDDDATILSDAGVTVLESTFADRLNIRAQDTTSLDDIRVRGKSQIFGSDLLIFDSRFDAGVKVRLGKGDDTFVIEGSMFTILNADGGKGDNSIEISDDTLIDELLLKRFTEA